MDATQFPVDVLDAAFAFHELFMLARFAGFFWEEQGTLETLSAEAVGVVEGDGWVHGQADGAERSAIAQALTRRFAGLSERNGGNAVVTSGCLVNIPCIIGCIGCEMSRILPKGEANLMMERTEIRHVAFIKRLGVLCQHDIAVIGSSGSGNARAIAPKEFFLLFLLFFLW